MLEQLKRLFNHFHEAIYIVDTHRKILYYNPEAEKISGFTKDEMIGTHCWDNKLNHIDEKVKRLCLDGCPLQQSIRENIITDNYVYLQHKNGHRKLVHVKAIPLEINGEMIGAIEVFTDQTTKSMLLEEEKLSSILTYIDPLTGLLNRMFMQIKLKPLLEDKKLQEWGLCFLDLDNFKRTNDVYGHLIGDKLLEAVSHTILDSLNENDLAFRYGGDELIVMFHHVSKEVLLKKASLLQVIIQATRLKDIDNDQLTETSIGVTLLHNSLDLTKAIDVADQAMYIAKKSGKNKIQFLDMDEY